MNNIINLLKLQYIHALCIRKYLMVLLTFSIIMMIANDEFLVVGTAIMIMCLNYTVVAYEDKSKCENLIYALPVSPGQYILCKYVYGYINTAIVTGVILLINKFISKGNISGSDVIIYPLVIGCFMVSVIVPLALIFGFDKVRYILIFMCCISICIAQKVFPMSYHFNGSNNNVIFVVAFIVLNIISYLITVKVYCKRDK